MIDGLKFSNQGGGMKLKPCPFCGGSARVFETDSGDCNPKTYYGIACDTAGCFVYEGGDAWEDNEKEAADRWNDRRVRSAR